MAIHRGGGETKEERRERKIEKTRKEETKTKE